MFMPGFEFYEVKKKKLLLFFKKKMEILLHFLSFLQWKVFKKSKIAQIYYYGPQSAGINLQSPQSDSTPWTLTLPLFQREFLIFDLLQGTSFVSLKNLDVCNQDHISYKGFYQDALYCFIVHFRTLSFANRVRS